MVIVDSWENPPAFNNEKTGYKKDEYYNNTEPQDREVFSSGTNQRFKLNFMSYSTCSERGGIQMLRERDDTKRYPNLEHQHELDKKTRDYQAERAEACQRSECLRAEINNDIQAGEDPLKILLKAVECISLVTGDDVFNEQNRKLLMKRQAATPERN